MGGPQAALVIVSYLQIMVPLMPYIESTCFPPKNHRNCSLLRALGIEAPFLGFSGENNARAKGVLLGEVEGVCECLWSIPESRQRGGWWKGCSNPFASSTVRLSPHHLPCMNSSPLRSKVAAVLCIGVFVCVCVGGCMSIGKGLR